MRFVVFGAGGIGATIGARLSLAGAEVVLIARGRHLDVLQSAGLRFVAPDGEYQLPLDAVRHPGEIRWTEGDVVLLTVKSQQTAQALDALAAALARIEFPVPVVCAQNGVANERMALRRLPGVYSMVVNLPALHLNPGEVVTHAAGCGGILDVGRYPRGCDPICDEMAGWMTRAGFSSLPEPEIMRWKYAKLLMNLGNALQAAVTSEERAEECPEAAQREIYRALRTEALACYAAAGIDCETRDEVRSRHVDTYAMVDISGWPRTGGSSWQSVKRATGDIETDFLNGEIVLLGGHHGIPTPANRVCQRLARRLIHERLPVGSFDPAGILTMIEGEI